ncbi:MAG: N-acetylmuramoyl-L-alanine amidase, partial [Frankiales bacterium]|nr:N-acetylmuramoyl-L-alanine amidase [Frankiales bacterium]
MARRALCAAVLSLTAAGLLSLPSATAHAGPVAGTATAASAASSRLAAVGQSVFNQGVHAGKVSVGLAHVQPASTSQTGPASGAIPNSAASPPRSAVSPPRSAVSPQSVAGVAGSFVGLKPARLLDTRPGAKTVDRASAGVGVIRGGRSLTVRVGGRAGVPASAIAVVVNLTVASATVSSYLTLYPAGSSRPATSNLNIVPKQVTAVQSTVALGSSGAIMVFNNSGNANVVIDVLGYYAGAGDSSSSESAFHQQTPVRLADTRTIVGGLPAGAYLSIDLSLATLTGVAVNVTVTAPSRSGYLAVWPGSGGAAPATSALNFSPGQTLANMAVTETLADDETGYQSFSVGNFSAGPVQVILDVTGYFAPASVGGGSLFHVTRPTRIIDSRHGIGVAHAIGRGQKVTVATATRFGDADTTALVANATGLNDTGATYLTVYPGGVAKPTTSSLNLAPKEIRSNLVMTGLGTTALRSLSAYNLSGNLDLLVDVVGYFEVAQHASVTKVASTTAHSTYDQALTLTTAVSGIGVAPTGLVAFIDAANGSVLAIKPLTHAAASLTTAALAPGVRTIGVVYSGDATHSSGISSLVTITVAAPAAGLATAFQNDPRHDGADTADQFDPATLHEAWSVNLDPSGQASVSYPVIAGGRVFVTVGSGVSGKALYAFDAASGAVDWQASVGRGAHLTYDGGQLFVQTETGGVTAYNAATGGVNWTAALGDLAFTAAPTAYDGVLYTTGAVSDGTVFALSEATGDVMWAADVASGDVSSPTVDDSGVYEDYTCDRSYGLDLDGEVRWDDTFGCASGGGVTSTLHNGSLYLRGDPLGATTRIVSAATGA